MASMSRAWLTVIAWEYYELWYHLASVFLTVASFGNDNDKMTIKHLDSINSGNYYYEWILVDFILFLKPNVMLYPKLQHATKYNS